LVKTSRIFWYTGILAIVASGVVNGFALEEGLRIVTVQVPTHTLSPYQTITASDVTTKKIPASALDIGTVKGSVIGRITAMTIPQGDQIQNFEIAQQGSLAQVIQNLYQTNPNDAFAQIQVPESQLNQTIQPGQHINLTANGIVYQNVWVLSVTDPNGTTQNVGSEISNAVTNFVSVTPSSSTPTGGNMTLLIGGAWPTVQSLMNASNIQVVMGNTDGNAVQQQYNFGSPPVSQSSTTNAMQSTLSVNMPNTPNIPVHNPAMAVKKIGNQTKK
jgi:hypothetical protein